MDYEKFNLLKSHVEQYTRSDGTVVQAHDDKRTAAQPKPASHTVGTAAPAAGNGSTPHMKFHDLEADHHVAASAKAANEDYPSGEKLHDKAASAHEAAYKAHKDGASNAHELTAAAVAASAKADDAFDRKKKEPKPQSQAGAPAGQDASAFHDGEADAHTAASVRASREGDEKGELYHDKAASAHESAAHAHKSGSPDAAALSDAAKKATDLAGQFYDRGKPKMAKAHVDQYTRSDGTVVQAHDDKRKAAKPKPAGPAPLSTHAKALSASSKPGDLDHTDNQIAAGYMQKGDHKALANHIQNLDTAARDHILDHVHPEHREALGFQQLNMERSKTRYAQKFPGQADK